MVSIYLTYNTAMNVLYLIWMLQTETFNKDSNEYWFNKYLFFEIYFGLSIYINIIVPLIGCLDPKYVCINDSDFIRKVKSVLSILYMIQRICFIGFASTIIIQMYHNYILLVFFGITDFIALSLLLERWTHQNCSDVGESENSNSSEENEINVEGSVIDTEEENNLIEKINEQINDETIIMPDERCPICLESFDKQTTGNKIECEHIFHKSCIVEWLKKNTTCPVCRKNII